MLHPLSLTTDIANTIFQYVYFVYFFQSNSLQGQKRKGIISLKQFDFCSEFLYSSELISVFCTKMFLSLILFKTPFSIHRFPSEHMENARKDEAKAKKKMFRKGEQIKQEGKTNTVVPTLGGTSCLYSVSLKEGRKKVITLFSSLSCVVHG